MQEHQGTRLGTMLEKLLSWDLGKGPGRATAGGSLGGGAGVVVLLLL